MNALVKARIGIDSSAPDDAADDDADRDAQQHRERVQLDRPAQQERLQDVALDLHHRDDAGQHDQGLDPAERDQRDQTARKPETNAPTSGTNAPMKTSAASAGASGTPRISATMSTPTRVDQRRPGWWPGRRRPATASPAGRPVDPVPGVPGEEAQQERPDAAAVVQEVEEREDRDGQAGEEVPDAGADARGVAGDGALARAQELLDPGDPFVDLQPALVDRQRARRVARRADR